MWGIGVGAGDDAAQILIAEFLGVGHQSIKSQPSRGLALRFANRKRVRVALGNHRLGHHKGADSLIEASSRIVSILSSSLRFRPPSGSRVEQIHT